MLITQKWLKLRNSNSAQVFPGTVRTLPLKIRGGTGSEFLRVPDPDTRPLLPGQIRVVAGSGYLIYYVTCYGVTLLLCGTPPLLLFDNVTLICAKQQVGNYRQATITGLCSAIRLYIHRQRPKGSRRCKQCSRESHCVIASFANTHITICRVSWLIKPSRGRLPSPRPAKQQVDNYRLRVTSQCCASKTVARQILALHFTTLHIVESHKNCDKYPNPATF